MLVKLMAGDGRVARSAGEIDRRQSMVRITPAGRAALGPLLARSKRHERAVVARLDQDEAASLKNTLRKLIAAD